MKNIKKKSSGIKTTVIREEKRKYYVYKYEAWELEGCDVTFMHSAYSIVDGSYIGNIEDAESLGKRFGITPQRFGKNGVASIGFSKKFKRWYGWSHRAICGFKLGSIVKEGSVTAEYMKVGFKAKTYKDAKKMAIAFAKSVS